MAQTTKQSDESEIINDGHSRLESFQIVFSQTSVTGLSFRVND